MRVTRPVVLVSTLALLLMCGCDRCGAPPKNGGKKTTGEPTTTGKVVEEVDPTKALQSTELADREKAFRSLRKAGTTDGLQLVLEHLHHEADDTLMRAMREWLLGSSTDELAALAKFAHHNEHPDVRAMWAAAAGHGKDPRFIDDLITLAGDKEASVRVQAIRSMIPHRAVARVESVLAKTLTDADPLVRQAAAEQLGRTAEGEKDWRVQVAASHEHPDPELVWPAMFEGRTKPYAKADATVDAAVRKGLLWLVRHQDQDGSWNGLGNNRRGPGGLPEISHEVAYAQISLTGLAVLSMLHAGVYPGEGRIGHHLELGLRFILKMQGTVGMIGLTEDQEAEITKALGKRDWQPKQLVHMFNHAIGTWAVVEAAATTRDSDVEIPAARALQMLEKMKHEKYGWSRWFDPDDDIAYAGYTLMAILVTKALGEEWFWKETVQAAEKYLKKVTQPATGRVYHGGGRAFCFGGYDSTATALFLRELMGLKIGNADTRGAAYVFSRMPRWSGRFPEPHSLAAMANDPGSVTNFHYWQFGALAATRRPDDAAAKRWTAELRKVLLAHQRPAPWDAGGSWDPVGPWARVGGRVYSTASALLTLLAPRAYRWNAE